ncbi:MAG: flagellar assembly protein FliW [Atribacterota bacterium]|jgi:flagellar assembly factor FliW|nr:flagellar assembly protein FliW [Atribacterota bacterium]HOA99238.1 flagellar assembly protein FliW [Candidatus Atribacteria bacterium]MDI9606680.1 flagellar assembly protein FliW [Atribacterota bacterium]MDY0135381.1 flagellar assembly protein FliW [Atribacterota bacterium]HOQ51816.1 flagellar assembly protein FliW [Candidatus Atribacteria bacterium]
MKIPTRYFGEIEVEEGKFILFPWGLPGFENLRQFLLLEEEGFFWLQSVEERDVIFAVCDPFLYFPDYEVDIPSSECQALGIISEEEVIVLAIMNIQSPQDIKVNLLAPVIINCRLKMGKQIVLEDERYSLHHPLFPEKASSSAG